MEKFEEGFKECIKKKRLKAAKEPDTYYFSELPWTIPETQIENPAV